jgi:hypothetical protein
MGAYKASMHFVVANNINWQFVYRYSSCHFFNAFTQKKCILLHFAQFSTVITICFNLINVLYSVLVLVDFNVNNGLFFNATGGIIMT